MDQPLLEVKNLTTSFKIHTQWVNAVDDVSFTIDQGEILGIVGESGCGKSVTALSILKLITLTNFRIDSGQVLFMGQSISELDQKELSSVRGKKISMIFQDPMTSLNPSMTIGKQLIEALSVHEKVDTREAQRRSIEVLGKMGLPSPEKRMKEYPHQLSGGMRQRIVIAMAFIQNPPLIIADEPTTALDVTTQAQILDLLKELKETTHASIMLITHDMGVVAEMTDRIMVMYAGNVMEVGTTLEVFKQPLHPYTVGLLGSIPRKDRDLDTLFSIGGSVPTLTSMPEGCRFSTRCAHVQERCLREKPPLVSKGGRMVRCFKYEEEGGVHEHR